MESRLLQEEDKITFKRNKPTGRYSSSQLTHTEIKCNKQIFGGIFEQKGGTWRVKIKASNESDFNWRSFKRSFANEKEARDFVLSDRFKKSLTEVKLHFD